MNKKALLIVLSLVILTASIFMITESARYYEFFYDDGAWQPLYLAGLLEAFVLVLAVIKIKARWWFQWLQKGIMVGVFCAIILAAGMQAIKPTLDAVEGIKQKNELTSILKEEYKNLQKDVDVFDKQRQKRNTAISAVERRKIVNDLKETLKDDVVSNTGIVALLNIFILFLIRFLVQLANVFCATLLGKYYRFKEVPKLIGRSYKRRVLERYPDVECRQGVDKKFTVYNGDEAVVQSPSSIDAWKDAYNILFKK